MRVPVFPIRIEPVSCIAPFEVLSGTLSEKPKADGEALLITTWSRACLSEEVILAFRIVGRLASEVFRVAWSRCLVLLPRPFRQLVYGLSSFQFSSGDLPASAA